MNKAISRCLAIALVIVAISGALSMPVTATTNSSAYIWRYAASLSQGSSSGKISVNYSITGMGIMDAIGVSKIVVYKADGTKYRTIYGSVSNGLIKNNTSTAADSYEISCVAGSSYYCEVTFYAAKSGGYDTRTVQTGTVVAPTSP